MFFLREKKASTIWIEVYTSLRFSDYESTKLLGSAPHHIIKYLTEKDISYNNHFRGITKEVSYLYSLLRIWHNHWLAHWWVIRLSKNCVSQQWLVVSKVSEYRLWILITFGYLTSRSAKLNPLLKSNESGILARLLLYPFSASFALFICALWVLFFFCIQTFLKDEKLREFFQIVSTNKDRKGKTFISTMEGKQLHHGKREWKIGTLFPVPLKLFLHHSRLCISIRALWSPRSFTRIFILHKNIHATCILQKNGYYV